MSPSYVGSGLEVCGVSPDPMDVFLLGSPPPASCLVAVVCPYLFSLFSFIDPEPPSWRTSQRVTRLKAYWFDLVLQPAQQNIATQSNANESQAIQVNAEQTNEREST